jgi:hypothetical protein
MDQNLTVQKKRRGELTAGSTPARFGGSGFDGEADLVVFWRRGGVDAAQVDAARTRARSAVLISSWSFEEGQLEEARPR